MFGGVCGAGRLVAVADAAATPAVGIHDRGHSGDSGSAGGGVRAGSDAVCEMRFTETLRKWRDLLPPMGSARRAPRLENYPPRGRPLYGGGLGLRRTARAGVIQDAADFGFVEGLGEQVVSAQVEGFGPETGIRLRIGDDHFGFPRAFADQVQDIEPLAIGQLG